MHKRNHLFLILLITVLTTSLFSNNAHAINLNPGGIGEVLIYPYYTTNNDLDTLISIVNTTDQVKAVKVRFLEGDNSQAVFNQHLYLSPFDVWTAAVSRLGDGAQLFTADTSCLLFTSNPQAFDNSNYLLDPGSDDREREREGHIEIIDMATITDSALALAATHQNGTPNDCAALETAWSSGGQWFINSSDGAGFANGGLTGSAVIVNVAEGTAISYRAEALEGYYPASGGLFHSDPGTLFPSLLSADSTSRILYKGQLVESEWNDGADAVSALFMRDQLYNEYVLDSGINAKTEWVLTFPTKRFLVTNLSRPPFTSVFDGPEGACEPFNYEHFFDREENVRGASSNDLPELCWETNVIQFYNSDAGGSATTPSSILGSNNVVNQNTNPYAAGWVSLRFPASAGLTDALGAFSYSGYPVTGFAVQTYTNSNAQPGLLAQYAALFNHAYKMNITSNN